MTEPIVVERHVAAEPPAVYSHLVESNRWAMWQGTAAEVDARPGGLFTVTMPDGAQARGEFVELVPDRRVVFSWGWEDHDGIPPGSTTVEIDLIPDADGTLIRLTHRGIPPAERDLHLAGWEHYVPRLVVASLGGSPRPDVVMP